MTYPFLWVDVFTTDPLGGNPLAVVLDADALDTERMQAIARELNLSETTFVLEPRLREARRRLRSFSPSSEVFGAGHNALGAWWAILSREKPPVADGDHEIFQELGDRLLPVLASYRSGRLVRIAMIQAPPVVGPKGPEREALSRALSLPPDSLEVDGLEPRVVSTGASHLLVPARGLSDLARARVNAPELVALARPLGCEGCYLFCLETREPASLAHARGFFPGIGIAEDPATGSAAGPLTHYLAASGRAREGEWLTIEQGDELGRPSRIEVRVTEGRVEVAGACAILAEGAIRSIS
jgi:PhzF family phenazine biosynthesis protein